MMLYNFKWLETGQQFPPVCEVPRITRYLQNAMLFDGDHFADRALRTTEFNAGLPVSVYAKCSERISRVIGNFQEIISFPVLLNYQRLMSLKMADLVCGEIPSISGATPEENAIITDLRNYAEFDTKIYSTVLDISRYGDALWRLYRDADGKDTFTCWNPMQWYPIVMQDGTNTIVCHCLCWKENLSEDVLNPDWRLHVQKHWTQAPKAGFYESEEYKLAKDSQTIVERLSATTVKTGFKRCAIEHLKAFGTTNSAYGYDDYLPIDSLLAEIMARVGQISVILDKHADPNITGPMSMLQPDPHTGELTLSLGKFWAVGENEEQPKYMTWDGQLEAAFKQLELLINQLYILSEMGAALLGSTDASVTAVSGTAMRFKMVNPLAKARRLSNSMTSAVRRLFSSLSARATLDPDDIVRGKVDKDTLQLPIPVKHISVFWADGLPDDPRENLELAKLASGETKLMPLEKAIMEYFGRSNKEALEWIEKIREETRENMAATQTEKNAADDPNKPGPQDGTGVNPQEKGSELGLTSFKGLTNE